MNKLKTVSLIGVLTIGMAFFNSCDTKKEKVVCNDRAGVNLIRDQYWLHVQLFNNVIDGVSEEEANHRISENTNSFKWIAGHTLDIQYNLASALGVTEPSENPYKAQFSYGKQFDPDADYPTLDKMREDWNKLVPEIMDAMEDTPITELAADLPGIPFPDETKVGMLGFQMHHLAYEIGQMGLYRKFLGKDGMSYKVDFSKRPTTKDTVPQEKK